jgi:hypothetical protein
LPDQQLTAGQQNPPQMLAETAVCGPFALTLFGHGFPFSLPTFQPSSLRHHGISTSSARRRCNVAAVIEREIPSTGERIPLIGLGSLRDSVAGYDSGGRALGNLRSRPCRPAVPAYRWMNW